MTKEKETTEQQEWIVFAWARDAAHRENFDRVFERRARGAWIQRFMYAADEAAAKQTAGTIGTALAEENLPYEWRVAIACPYLGESHSRPDAGRCYVIARGGRTRRADGMGDES